MAKQLIWDLPTRVCHAVLSIAVVGAFALAVGVGHRSPWFAYHMLLGLIAAAALAVRLAWGLVGTRHARWSAFRFSPADLLRYLVGAVTGRASRYAAHNPGSAYAGAAMFVLLAIVVGTGLLMGTGSEAAEEIHEPAAFALIAVVALHVAGVAWHGWRHRENLPRAIVTGWKEAEPSAAIASSRPAAGALAALLLATTAVSALANYDAESRTTRLPLFGTIALGEQEHGRRERGE